MKIGSVKSECYVDSLVVRCRRVCSFAEKRRTEHIDTGAGNDRNRMLEVLLTGCMHDDKLMRRLQRMATSVLKPILTEL